MKCPHCQTEFHDSERRLAIGTDVECGWIILHQTCPACKRFVIQLAKCHINSNFHNIASDIRDHEFVRPRAATRALPSPSVPAKIASDYVEACAVLSVSAKASAALSRRCLQHLLRDVAKVKHSDLYSEIQEVLDSQKLPSHIAESIDAVRHIGNFAAHPIKSSSSGEIVEVDPGEAEWNLDVLEALFDFYFVQPALTKTRRDALNEKLKQAGKKPMK